MADFYHIYIDPNPGTSVADIRGKMNLALDWFEYGGQNWIVYTTANAKKWHARLSPLVKPDGNLFIVKLDISDRQGWISKQLWKWLKEER